MCQCIKNTTEQAILHIPLAITKKRRKIKQDTESCFFPLLFSPGYQTMELSSLSSGAAAPSFIFAKALMFTGEKEGTSAGMTVTEEAWIY